MLDSKSLLYSDIGYVWYPDLIRSINNHIFDDVFMFVEPMKRVGSSVARFLSVYKHIVFFKDLEKRVSTDFKVGFIKLVFQRFFEFSNTFSRQGSAFLVYNLNNLLFKF